MYVNWNIFFYKYETFIEGNNFVGKIIHINSIR